MPIAPGNPAQRLTHDARHRYFWFTDVAGAVAVANVAAVTTTEIATADDLSRYTPKDGWQGSPNFSKVPNSDVTEDFDAEDQGTWSFSPTWQLYLQQPDNNAFDLFAPNGLAGLLLDFPFLDKGADPAAGDAYYAFHLRTSVPVPLPFTTNAKQRFSLDPALLEAPVYDGTLTA